MENIWFIKLNEMIFFIIWPSVLYEKSVLLFEIKYQVAGNIGKTRFSKLFTSLVVHFWRKQFVVSIESTFSWHLWQSSMNNQLMGMCFPQKWYMTFESTNPEDRWWTYFYSIKSRSKNWTNSNQCTEYSSFFVDSYN